ncbi:MAG: TolB family protein, partial [bacterium]
MLARDGKTLLYRTGDLAGAPRQIFVTQLDGKEAPVRVSVQGPIDFASRLSPDDKWVAFGSTGPSGVEVYVQPFPGPGARYRVSLDGGSEPLWSRDGRTLFYRSGPSLWAATISTTPTFNVTGRRKLFDGNFLADGSHAGYDVMPDGKHFLMLQLVERQTQTVMVYGWANELRKRWRK